MRTRSASGLAAAAILTLAAFGGDGDLGPQSALAVDGMGKPTGLSAPAGTVTARQVGRQDIVSRADSPAVSTVQAELVLPESNGRVALFGLSGGHVGRAVRIAETNAAGRASLGAVRFMPAAEGSERSPKESIPAVAAGGARGSAPPGRMASAPPTHVSLPSGSDHCTSFGRLPEEMKSGRIGRTRTSLGVSSAGDLAQKLSELDYSLGEVRIGVAAVPRLRVANLPPDMAGVGSVAERKRLFIMSILPLVLQVNEGILADRRKLLVLTASDSTLTQDERRWIAALAKRHGADAADRNELVMRVDAVPPSLAIAQAIVESGWGRSRFAVEANAFFGQWTFRSGSGVVPRQRDPGKGHEIRSFREPYQSVAAYMENLNSHRAYEKFRRQRNALRRSGEIPNGERLVGTLHNYSQRGQAYVETIRTIMRQNRLADFDRAHLVPDFTDPAVGCQTA